MKQYSHTFVSFVLLAIVTTGCNNQPQNPPSDIATPVSVTELKKGSISKLINTGRHSLRMESILTRK